MVFKHIIFSTIGMLDESKNHVKVYISLHIPAVDVLDCIYLSTWPVHCSDFFLEVGAWWPSSGASGWVQIPVAQGNVIEQDTLTTHISVPPSFYTDTSGHTVSRRRVLSVSSVHSQIHCYFLLKKCENPLQCKGFSHFFNKK